MFLFWSGKTNNTKQASKYTIKTTKQQQQQIKNKQTKNKNKQTNNKFVKTNNMYIHKNKIKQQQSCKQIHKTKQNNIPPISLM